MASEGELLDRLRAYFDDVGTKDWRIFKIREFVLLAESLTCITHARCTSLRRY
jgi:hypothetical protein